MTTIKEYVTESTKSQSMADQQIRFIVGNILLRTGAAFGLSKPRGMDCDDLDSLLKECTLEGATKIIPITLSKVELPRYILLTELYPNHNC